MREKELLKCVIYNGKSDVYNLKFVAGWACEVTLILTEKRLLHCVFV